MALRLMPLVTPNGAVAVAEWYLLVALQQLLAEVLFMVLAAVVLAQVRLLAGAVLFPLAAPQVVALIAMLLVVAAQ
jgi:hypothetical protein